MKGLFNKFRLKWFIANHGFSYTVSTMEQIYKIYLNHSKVIHYRDGFPVYSLSTPAFFSKPAGNFFARILYRTIQNKNLPNLMSFAVNDACNAACKHCSFFEGVHNPSRRVLTLPEAQKLIFDAQELGVSVINFVGGEPLLRADLPEIIRCVDKELSTTVLFTNGSLLSERARELRAVGLDSVYVSLDGPTAEIHDTFRRKPGLFQKCVEGISAAKRLGYSVGISYTVTPEAYARGELDAIVELGKSLGVHEVLVFDAMPTGRFKYREDLVDNSAWIEDMIHSVKKYNTDDTYPGIFFYAYATSHRSVGCSCGTSYFYVSPYGDVMSCDFNHCAFGNILEQPLYKIWDELTNKKDFLHAKWGGCKIKDSEYRKKETVSSSLSGCPCKE